MKHITHSTSRLRNPGARRWLIALPVIICSIAGHAQVAAPPRAVGDPAGFASGENTIDQDIEAEDVAEAMRVLSEATGLTILVSSKATGKITAYIKGMDPEDALEQTLTVNGLRCVQQGNVVWALTEQEYFEDFHMGMEHRIIPLQHAKALDVATTLQEEVSKAGRIVPYPETNVLVVAESAERIEAFAALVARLDRPPTTRVYGLKHAAAADAFALLQPMMSTPGALQADARTNQVVITDTPERLEQFDSLLKALDQPDQIDTRSFPLKHAHADEVADLLREMLTGRRTGGAGTPGASSTGQAPETQPRRILTTEPGRGRAATPLDNWRTRRAAGSSPPPASPAPSSSPAAPDAAPDAQAAPETEGLALGPLETVVADSRTNTVIVTHTASTLDRLAEVIAGIDVPSELHVYQFQNADPAKLELETKLAGLLSADGGYFNVEPISKKVLWRSPPEQAEEIRHLLEEWDQEVQQVRIEAEILSVNASLVRKLGISWQAILEELDDGILDRNIDLEVNFPTGIGDTSPQTRLQVGTLATDDYTATLQALESDSDTEVIASPRILVRDGQDALFSSARDEPYTVVVVDGNTHTTLQDVRFLNVGVTLAVLPTINREGMITLDVQLEISSLTGVRSGVPVVDRSTAQSSVKVRDGGTVLLGGLRQRSRTTASEGVPGLKKLPLLGGLFRSRTRDRGESEIVLILRPRRVGPSHNDVPGLADITLDRDLGMKEERMGATPRTSELGPDDLPDTN